MATTSSNGKPDIKRTAPKKGPVVSVEEFLALKPAKGDLLIEVDGSRVSLTSLDRVYWPEERLTKFDLLSYYIRVCDYIMPFLKARPAILQRWPRGINAPMFFQQDLESAPDFIETAHLTNNEGRELDYAVYSTTASLLHFVNLGTIEQHPWHSTIKRLSKPDWVAIDLDPKKAPWENVLQVALSVKEVCDGLGLEAFPKTSGSSGMHVYIPLKPQNHYEPRRICPAAGVRGRQPPASNCDGGTHIAKRKSDQIHVDSMQNARVKPGDIHGARETQSNCVDALT